jgi:hypothetical protein
MGVRYGDVVTAGQQGCTHGVVALGWRSSKGRRAASVARQQCGGKRSYGR